jgi:small subunit ribosomal protein S1
VLRGTVKNLTDYGAFIDLGRHRRPAAHHGHVVGRVTHPSEVVRVGDEIDVVVLKYDPGTERVSLGHKQIVPDPWSNVIERYPVGHPRDGQGRQPDRLRRVHRARAGRRGPDPRLGNVVEQARQASRRRFSTRATRSRRWCSASIPVARRISLGLKQVETNPWTSSPSKYPVGTTISGKVRNLTEFGAFVEVEEGIDGLIHISDMSWSKIKHPSEVLKKGDTVEAQVLSIDADNQRLFARTQAAADRHLERVLRRAQGRRHSSKARSSGSPTSARSSSWRTASRA